MTWIKPSFLWMMYRCGWATKPGQERVLAITIRRAGFEWALAHAALSAYEHRFHARGRNGSVAPGPRPVGSGARPRLRPLPYRAIQVGLAGEAVDRYVDEWTTASTTSRRWRARSRGLAAHGALDAARRRLPLERPLT